MMKRVSAADARKDFSSLVNSAVYSREPIIVTRHDRDVAALVSMEDLTLYRRLLERFEDDSEVQRLAQETAEVHTRIDAFEFAAEACTKTSVSAQKYAEVVERVNERRTANEALRELIATYGD